MSISSMPSRSDLRRPPTRSGGRAGVSGPFCAAALGLLYLLSCGSAGAAAAATGETAHPHSIDALRWLEGVWDARNGEDDVEEVYGPVNGNEILSTFKAVTRGAVSRYELRSYRLQGDRIICQELAYGPGLAQAAPVPTRTLLSADAAHLQFDGVLITRTGPDAMLVIVTLRTPAGGTRQVAVHYRRVSRLRP